MILSCPLCLPQILASFLSFLLVPPTSQKQASKQEKKPVVQSVSLSVFSSLALFLQAAFVFSISSTFLPKPFKLLLFKVSISCIILAESFFKKLLLPSLILLHVCQNPGSSFFGFPSLEHSCQNSWSLCFPSLLVHFCLNPPSFFSFPTLLHSCQNPCSFCFHLFYISATKSFQLLFSISSILSFKLFVSISSTFLPLILQVLFCFPSLSTFLISNLLLNPHENETF